MICGAENRIDSYWVPNLLNRKCRTDHDAPRSSASRQATSQFVQNRPRHLPGFPASAGRAADHFFANKEALVAAHNVHGASNFSADIVANPELSRPYVSPRL